ncbi:cytochrome c biogenesis CcdA family protein [Cupriavidus sp. WGtm5]|uniref:cytochrome c biogenesis CcdA family protein n=1 Tax=Cupriavidus TaxID=106589 RepID=UPI000E1074BC|nr:MULTISPECIES: cytochrome c biogenesis CcdA family protein [Cupriavidus]MCO4891609.1 cytochrome c biogenesis CcdA family protein [Cupriavidus sp. WGtm5]ULX51655.1 cytochrome C biogenesis protein [Cupriavidus taiwanensis]SPA42772.1 Cytochrome c-type biogenesis protein [Cupriavidus taiwanensis]
MIDAYLAFAAGVLTIASPCVLPVLPMLLGASLGETSRLRPLAIALGFVSAFSALGIVFGALTSAFSDAPGVVRNVAIAILFAAGLARLWPAGFGRLTAPFAAPFAALTDRAAGAGSRAGNGLAGGFVLGMTLGAVWTPCAGPVLASILALVAKAQDLHRAAGLLALFAAGAAVPMLGIAYGGQFATTHVRRLARHTPRLQQAFGVLVVATAIAMYFQYDTLAVAWLTSLFPATQPGA